MHSIPKQGSAVKQPKQHMACNVALFDMRTAEGLFYSLEASTLEISKAFDAAEANWKEFTKRSR